jgi:hypothetical protein
LNTGETDFSPQILKCFYADIASPECTYGAPTAATKIVMLGDSVGAGYAEILRELAVDSNGDVQTTNATLASCVFGQDTTYRKSVAPSCEDRKNTSVDLINAIRPDVVVITNGYVETFVRGASRAMTMADWSDSLSRFIDRFKGSTKKVVLLSPPPSDVAMWECVGRRNSKPADCIGEIPAPWKSMAETERQLAARIGAVWIDSRPWFCDSSGRCPSFVGTTPARVDEMHTSPAYASKILPVVVESFRNAGVPIPAS